MKKNLDVIIFAVFALLIAVWAGITFVNQNKNISELETENPSLPTVTEKEEETTEEEKEVFLAHSTENTEPEKFGLNCEIFQDGKKFETFSSPNLDFGFTNTYTNQNGIVTFRGNNFRNSAVFGSAQLSDKKISDTLWQVTTGSLSSGSGYAAWTGSGWTGQPLIVTWDEETKQQMNIYPDKKAKQNLTEIIYATMSGEIYFLDLDDGSFTRDTLNLGFTFKGAGALDPRGYPLMYVGAGDYNPQGTAPKMFIISLIDGKVLYEMSGHDTQSHRPNWGAFDSSALVSAETDTLIYPCENGIIYSIKLNSVFDKQNGTVSVNPDSPVKLKITTSRSNSENYWYGFETSAVFYGKYMYIADNGGYLYCIDMQTLEVIWMQDVIDDTNSSPVLELENGKPYIYISTSLHWTEKGSRGDIPVFKIDAENGEIVWQKIYNCATVSGTSGGVQGTIALGKNDSADLIFVPLAHFPNRYQGGIAALNKNTGEQVWYYEGANYTWSSPVVVTGNDGTSVVISCDVAGDIVMLDAKTGTLLDKKSGGGLIEASPIVFNDTLIIGTRNRFIKGFKLS